MKYWVVIPAAGSGSRMGLDRPKQYLPLLGKPVLQHTLERLCLPAISGIIVCTAPQDAIWQTLTLQLPVPIWQVTGGTERFHTVLKGLEKLVDIAQPTDWVLVHDAARPCVRRADIEKLLTQLAQHPIGGLLAVPVRDTMKKANTQGLVIETVNRENMWHALTPQMFRLNKLLTALEQVIANGDTVTDEAQAMERLGYQPVLVEGHADNIKITHPQDLQWAELFLQQQVHHAC
ncbi:MAG: 2-C-methyl-D-erythritol 4-phosphate cytidylyltransferase [Beggiatoa sp. IS2]|nr:MAG: 2-C-methyl-D-erythritol 4-phosphate cytidylyltransferase [Beggiatoa sp. IS2]